MSEIKVCLLHLDVRSNWQIRQVAKKLQNYKFVNCKCILVNKNGVSKIIKLIFLALDKLTKWMKKDKKI